MNTIKLLDKNTIDKIAAGEVVDRPASIVKELVENAIDAGATSISIEIKDGGISLIRITDNGSGIAKDQIAIAFLRHSTSKINDAADLAFIHTLGFRGEALSSIAAVSQTELCTKTKDDLTGVIYKINGGVEESLSEAGLPNGTTLIVKNLFYNTPARLKFLKSAQTEAGYVMDIVQRIALSHPEIAFKYVANGSVKLSTSGNGSLKDAVYSVFGRDITANLLQIDDSDETLSVSGFIGKPEIARGNRNFEYFFINGRYIKDKIIQKALEEAYLGYQMKGTFPFAVLNINIEPELVDVNVHPSKMEIRFFNNEVVFNSVYEIIRNRITRRENIPLVSLSRANTAPPVPEEYVPEPFEQAAARKPSLYTDSQDFKTIREETNYTGRYSNTLRSSADNSSYTEQLESLQSYTKAADDMDILDTDTAEDKSFAANEGAAFTISSKLANENVPYEQSEIIIPDFVSKAARKSHRIVGEVFDTYWIVEYDDSMFIIDQHAAHEKVLYEKFINNLKNDKHYSQHIMPSIIVTLTQQEENILKKYMSSFTELGFEIEHFGGCEYMISAVPTDLYSLDNSILFLELLDDLSDISSKSGPEIIIDRVATAACKAAVKGGNRLSLAEANTLIDELLSLDNPYNCPHGRPTIISMSRTELEKKFKRII